MKPQHLRQMLAAALVMSSLPTLGQEVDVMTFTPPEPERRVNPNYPLDALQVGGEATVELQLMVDKEGKPFEVTVTNLMGDDAFADEAVRAVRRWTYSPAMVDGEPIVGSVRTMIRFKLENEDGSPIGAQRTFINSYRAFLEALPAGKEAAESKLAVLESKARNHYENAYLNLARYLLAKDHGSSLEQMRFLHAAVSFSREVSDESYLPDDDARLARRELFRLQAANQYFREAMDTYRVIEGKGDTEAVGVLTPAYEQIQALEFSEKAYGMPITLREDGASDLKLLKHNVYIEQVTGKVSEFKVRCEKNYVGFAVEAEISYNIPAEWGVCDLEILGEAGSSFTLVQH
jgi:TonB family protein